MTPDEATSFPIDLKTHCGYVYCLTFPNGKKYIGQCTRKWRHRWSLHKYNKSCCKAVHSAILKYGSANVQWEILSYADSKEELNFIESDYIRKLNTIAPNGYNLKTKDTRTVYSESTLIKMSISQTIISNKKKGIILSKEDAWNKHKEKMLKKLSQPRYSQASDTGINIISYITSLHRNEIFIKSHIYRHSEKTKIEGISPEVRAKLKIAARRRSSKRLVCYETGEIFACIPDVVEKYTHLNRTKISACCTGRCKSTHGMHFYYVDTPKDRLQHLINYWNSPIQQPQQRRKVQCLDTGIVYDSVHAAKRETGCHHIEAVCRGKRKADHGLHWAYV